MTESKLNKVTFRAPNQGTLLETTNNTSHMTWSLPAVPKGFWRTPSEFLQDLETGEVKGNDRFAYTRGRPRSGLAVMDLRLSTDAIVNEWEVIMDKATVANIVQKVRDTVPLIHNKSDE